MSNATKLEHWRELFSLYRQCDMTVADFCRQHSVRVHQFYYWRAKLCSVPPANGSALIPVQLPTQYPAVPVREVRVRLPNGVEIEALSADQLHAFLPEFAAL